jgi:hypothetical protein
MAKIKNNRRYYLHRKVKQINGVLLSVKLKTMYINSNDNPARYIENKYILALVNAGYSLQTQIN